VDLGFLEFSEGCLFLTDELNINSYSNTSFGFLIYPLIWAKECNIETASKMPMHLLQVVSAALELRESLRQLQEEDQGDKKQG
jgi:hypothetical protein